ncbi:MAG: FtsX-like permease family protein [Spirochaetes bacterium]|nr:FtsX-like permease family protein [Spirochaetota bacterium]
MLILKIAFRSVLRYKGKLIAIGILILFGVLFLLIGNSFVYSLKEATKNSIINNYTGHIVIYSSKSKILPSPFSFSQPLPTIENFDQIVKFLKDQDKIKAYVPMAQNFAIVDTDSDISVSIVFNAIDPKKYEGIFKNIEIIEGSFFNESGIIISTNTKKSLKERGIDVKIGDILTLIGTSGSSSINSKKVKVVGIFRNKLFNDQFRGIDYIDIETYKELFNFQGLLIESLPNNLQKLLSTGSEEDIFAEDSVSEEKNRETIDFSKLSWSNNSGVTMIMVLLKNEKDIPEIISKINEKKELGVKVVDWRKASAGIYEIANAIQIFITIIAFILFITVGIILMNTFIINIFERTAEIGTIRAIGGSKSFIAKQYIYESLIVTIFFTILGIIIGAVVVFIIGKVGISLPKNFAQMMYGGGKLFFKLTSSSLISIFIILILVTILSTLYPLKVATKITPLKAMLERV